MYFNVDVTERWDIKVTWCCKGIYMIFSVHVLTLPAISREYLDLSTKISDIFVQNLIFMDD